MFWYAVAVAVVLLMVMTAIQWARAVREQREVFAARIGLDLEGYLSS